MKLDLDTLKYIKFSFELHSDHSTRCNGYFSLCRIIEVAEKEEIAAKKPPSDRQINDCDCGQPSCGYCHG